MHLRQENRIESLRRLLKDDDSDAFLVSSATNVQYLTGFTGDSTAILVTPTRVLAISDFRYEEQMQAEAPGLEVVIRPVHQTLWEAIAELIGQMAIARLGFEANAMLVVDQLRLYELLPTITMIGLVGKVESLRVIKHDDEIAIIRSAVRVAERAFRMLRDGLDPRETELQTANLLESYLKRCGSSKPPFDPIVAVGANSALPHAVPMADRSLELAPFVLVDWGATVSGYRSDLTRMIATGNVGDEFRKVYEVVLDAQERAIAAIRPGVLTKSVDAEARSTIERAGLGKRFGHGTGHGIGLAIHELPSLRPANEDVLQAGMVLTVEPGVYLAGWGGIRIEDDILVTPDGFEVLSSLPKSFDSLGLA